MSTSEGTWPLLHPVVSAVTQRIRQRSHALRSAYLERLDRMSALARGADRMGCANVAHAFAAMPAQDKFRVVVQKAPHIGVVTAYNDMLSAHQPYETYPALIRDEARRLGATAQVAGGVPAMCDGITQGQPGMELSLFSRDMPSRPTRILPLPSKSWGRRRKAFWRASALWLRMALYNQRRTINGR